ncbi:hypothetical protein QFC21_000781 [Naganishia friedmannii]|uniref:Uncharacterized protein n=1 Tax=Naganishia friedmannii TaxID=89922 RepID=A0ACC2W7D9_9TREE|nr:hypothetical protein QFC21_000781 [Naganishia friedmannii]
MLHRGHRTWTPYVDPHPDKENALSGLPLKTPIRHAGQFGGGKHHTTNGKASLLGGKQAAPFTGNGKAAGSSLLGKGKEVASGIEGKRMPMTVFKDRNLVLTGRKNGVSMRGSAEEGSSGEGDTFGIKKLEFKVAGTTSTKPKSNLSQQVSIPSPADDGFSALPQETPFTAKTQARASLNGVESTPLPSATRSRRRSRSTFTPLRPSPDSLQPLQMASTPLPSRLSTGSVNRFPSSTSLSNLLAPAPPLDKSFVTPARPSYRAYLSPPDYEMDGEDEDISGRDESFEMGDMRQRMGSLGVVDENEGEMMMDAEMDAEMQIDATVESDDEVEYMPPKVVPLPEGIPFDFVPLKLLGQQLNQIKSDFFIAESDSDDDAYPYVERLWSFDMGKQELLLGGWEGDDDVLPVGGAREFSGAKRLQLKLNVEFNNPIFATLKINKSRVSGPSRRTAPAAAQTASHPRTPTGRRLPTSTTSRPSSSTIASRAQVPATVKRQPISSVSKPVSSTTTRQPLPFPQVRAHAPLPSVTRNGITQTTIRRPVTATPQQKDTTRRPGMTRPAIGDRPRTVIRSVPAPTPEPVLYCEDIGFDL